MDLVLVSVINKELKYDWLTQWSRIFYIFAIHSSRERSEICESQKPPLYTVSTVHSSYCVVTVSTVYSSYCVQ